ncbi:MAG: hypothetical protein U0768_12070 [Anaerolineae bacterium]
MPAKKTSKNEEFEAPTDTTKEGTMSDENWQNPPETASEGQGAGATGVSSQEELKSSGFSDSVLDTFHAAAEWLAQKPYGEGQAMSAEALEGEGNIVGVGLGYAGPDVGLEPGAPAVNVYVQSPMSSDAAHAVFADAMGIKQASGEAAPINVVVTGPLEAQSFTARFRASPCGVSIGHYKITAGTQGSLATGRHAPRNQRLLILSNNHVLANQNNCAYGDNILQPGPYDGGNNPADRVAILESWIPLRFGSGQVNTVDCACGWAWPNLVRREFIYRTSSGLALFGVNRTPRACAYGMIVGKTGRTTELTTGRIIDCNFSGWVNYGSGRSAYFRDQIVITGLSGSFSAPGDSGSLIWSWDAVRNPVGLLFAGSTTHTIANKIGNVLDALDINLYT